MCFFSNVNINGNYTFLKDTLYHDDYIYTVKSDILDRGFFSGGKDKSIIYMDNEGNPLGEYVDGHTGSVCSLNQNKCNSNIFIYDLWDTTTRICLEKNYNDNKEIFNFKLKL